VEELNQAGITDENIEIIMAIGCRRPLMKADQEKKLGKSLRRGKFSCTENPVLPKTAGKLFIKL
jgi:nickel-dependent lactate racemase